MDASGIPLVSCIMPITEDRWEVAKLALDSYKAQTYPNLEMVVEDGPGTVGAKRNLACAKAKGEIIIHWDSDDWSAPERIADQVVRLIESGLEVTGYNEMRFIDEWGQFWLYKGHSNYALGTSLCYWRRFWQRRKFPDKQIGEDGDFIAGIRVATVSAIRFGLERSPKEDFMFATIHRGNTSPRTLRGQNWTLCA